MTFRTSRTWGNRRRRIAGVAVALTIVFAGIVLWPRARVSPGQIQPPLSDVISQMRADATPWSHHEKDASSLLADIRNHNVAAIGATYDAMLVSTRNGARYFVTDRSGDFSQSLQLQQLKSNDKPDYQMVWLPNAQLRPTPTWVVVFQVLFQSLLNLLFPILLLVGMGWYMRRDVTHGAKLLEKSPELRFDDVIGAGEAKVALKDVLAYFENPREFSRLGLRPPSVALIGGPGVGKTRLAKALAGECGANFISLTGGYFSSKWYGVGIQRVKHLWKIARARRPVILFIDEADGLGKRTDTNGGPGEAESNRIVNQILTEMDGFASNEGVVVVVATNHVDNLDEAFRRPGRIDREVHVHLPDVGDRTKIFEFYIGKLPSRAIDIDCEQLARLTTGMSPATLAAIVNQAGLVARRSGATRVTAEHLREAIKVSRIGDISGSQRSLDAEEVKRIAYHETGHALVAALLGAGVLEELTILPRGRALGFALITEQQDKQLFVESELNDKLMVLLGGRGAELLVYGEASSGAAHDLEEASRLSLDMVSRLGFNADGNLFSLAALPQHYAGPQMTEAIAQSNALLSRINAECLKLLERHRDLLEAIVEELRLKETMPGARVYELVDAYRAASASVQ